MRLFAGQGYGHEAPATCTTDPEGVCRIEPSATDRYLLVTDKEGQGATPSDADGFSYAYSVMIDLVDPPDDSAEAEWP